MHSPDVNTKADQYLYLGHADPDADPDSHRLIHSHGDLDTAHADEYPHTYSYAYQYRDVHSHPDTNANADSDHANRRMDPSSHGHTGRPGSDPHPASNTHRYDNLDAPVLCGDVYLHTDEDTNSNWAVDLSE
jgi:hypothetical protein